jgi:hypothetical protein
MNEQGRATDPFPVPRIARRLKWLGILLVPLLGVAILGYVLLAGRSKLDRIMADLDQNDPGWRWDELEARRPSIPDVDNSALCVDAVRKLLTDDWLQELDSEAPDRPIMQQIGDLERCIQLNEPQMRRLRTLLDKVKPALAQAQRLADLPCGEGSASLPEFPPSTAVTGNQRKVASLLSVHVAALIQEQKTDAALASIRGMINTARSAGHSPSSIDVLVRIAVLRQALGALKRAMAQGQPSDAVLQSMQLLLGDEEGQAALLAGLRGERAFHHESMQWMERGEWQRLDPTLANTGRGNPLQILSAGWYQRCHAATLELDTQLVEIARLPVDAQWDQLEAMRQRIQALKSSTSGAGMLSAAEYVMAVLAIEAEFKVVEASLRNQAELRCAIAAVAAERYRLANGHWPEALDQLVPKFLAAVAKDPFDGKPLRYHRLDDGMAVYSVGADGIDNGGNDDRKNYGKPGTDLVFRLWNVERRRQPALPVKAAEVKSKVPAK